MNITNAQYYKRAKEARCPNADLRVVIHLRGVVPTRRHTLREVEIEITVFGDQPIRLELIDLGHVHVHASAAVDAMLHFLAALNVCSGLARRPRVPLSHFGSEASHGTGRPHHQVGRHTALLLVDLNEDGLAARARPPWRGRRGGPSRPRESAPTRAPR